jgi:hypothetical protein
VDDDSAIEPDAVALGALLLDPDMVGVGETSLPVVCSWPFICEIAPAIIRPAVNCCKLR